MSRLIPVLIVVLALLGLAAPASGQLCGDPAHTFWKNDILPQAPAGAFSVAVLQGLCEGEAIAQVFDKTALGDQKVERVSVGFGHVLGGPGFSATCNIEIYDGVTINGSGIATLGPKVFDLGDDLAAEMELQSTAINLFDLSSQNIVVTQDKFVVAFRMAINFNGTCAGGHPASFLLDVPPGGGCTTTPDTSLIDTDSDPWQEFTQAKLLGLIQLCPQFINGNAIIRACTSNVGGGSGTFNDLRFSLPGNFSPTLSMSGSLLPAPAQYTFELDQMPPNDAMIMFAGFTRIDSPFFFGGTLVPSPDLIVILGSGPFGQLSITNSMPGGVPSGFTMYLHGWIADAGGPFGYSATNALEMIWP